MKEKAMSTETQMRRADDAVSESGMPMRRATDKPKPKMKLRTKILIGIDVLLFAIIIYCLPEMQYAEIFIEYILSGGEL
jgi:hypothetical protein